MIATLLVTLLAQSNNTLTAQEKADGWMLLFDGKTTHGWHNFKSDTISDGWVVKDGTLTNVEPGKAGDIVTSDKFDWFELKVDFNTSKEGNSGIMIRVGDDTEVIWHSGPEIQIYDHPIEENVETSGFLYQLYSSKVDASHPAGEWNSFHIIVSPKMCMTYLNGKKLYEYQYGSIDFWERVAKSKFAAFPEFAKSASGAIGIQGDHGVVSFRNIKIKKLSAK